LASEDIDGASASFGLIPLTCEKAMVLPIILFAYGNRQNEDVVLEGLDNPDANFLVSTRPTKIMAKTNVAKISLISSRSLVRYTATDTRLLLLHHTLDHSQRRSDVDMERACEVSLVRLGALATVGYLNVVE
jgi:hypothetical protein